MDYGGGIRICLLPLFICCSLLFQLQADGLSFHYPASASYRLAFHFADAINLYAQSLAFQQIDSIFGSHPDDVGHLSRFLAFGLQDDGVG